ncbi:MAG: MBL fold metallo-hydrolase [Gammaproteobacteria bacterium]|nr:MBL fold metallo-hydrolase [Gammaproteobacteria bacterium]MYH46285.1 MBL fold metallo-hydrolase [Gammaproteobacteria bacterium]MYL13900.1 MBL fold metallo-hydrolase [Gammaproteobacteria bacterium]
MKMRQKAAIWSALLLACLLGMHQGLAQDAAGQDDPELQRVAPFQVFDNLYYVGARWVSAWLLETDQGLILFDSLYGDLVDIAVDGILELGFDPDDIRYVIVSHARYDHVGGARRFQQEFGAVVLMTEADWQMSEGEAELREYPRPMRHLSLGNGDTLNLGRTRLQFLQTPGTTPGVLSTIFTVYDSGYPHTAVLFGGAELDFADPDRLRTFIDSVDRLLAVPGVEVNVANHPEAGDVFARYEMLQERRDGDPHPFVDPESWFAWLELLRRDAQTRLDAGTAAN